MTTTTPKTTKTQLRGHCQLCGSNQAVRKNGKGNIAHHGYKVMFSSFYGKCGGADFAPIEVDRSMLDKTVDYYQTGFLPMVEEELAEVRAIRERYVVSFQIAPEDADAEIPHPNGPKALSDAINPLGLLDASERFLVTKANGVRQHVAYLTGLADHYHGKPLTPVAPVVVPDLQVGERRYLASCKSVMTLVGPQGSKVVVSRDGSDRRIVVSRAQWDQGLDPSVVPEVKVGERRFLTGSMGGAYEAFGVHGLDKVLVREVRFRDHGYYTDTVSLKKWNASKIVD